MFGGLLANRNSDESAQKRQNYDEVKGPGGGLFGGFMNKTEKK